MADLNRAGRTFAQSLIDDGKVDKTSAWSFTAADGDKLLGTAGNDWANYGKNHMGADSGENFDTKAHWKYPFAKEGTLYRSALIAIRDRSGQRKDKAIYDAAGALLDEIDGTSDRTHENSTETGLNADGAGIIHVKSTMPRIDLEIQPRMEIASPVVESALDRWKAGIRVEKTDNANVIEVYDVIGYDPWTGGITAQSISDKLKTFGGADCEVHINSPGGDMFEGIAIYNLLRAYKGKVTVKVMSLAASAASVIAMAGDDVEMGDGTFLMIHNCWVIAMGNRHDMQDVADYLEPFDTAMCKLYCERTGEKEADVAAMMDKETYLSVDQAIKMGFADSKITKSSIIEDPKATDKAAELNAVRKIESILTRKGNMTRSKARALIQEIKGTKQVAGVGENDDTPCAVVATTQDAGELGWVAEVERLTAQLNAKN